jgi:THO complex subunit 1
MNLPGNADFLEKASLMEPLLSITEKAINVSSIPGNDSFNAPTAALRGEQFEIALRRHVVKAASKVTEKGVSELDELGVFWDLCLKVCLHIMIVNDKALVDSSAADPRYKDMSVRKVPFVLLEDILDVLSSPLALQFWSSRVRPSYDFLFAPTLWSPIRGDSAASPSHPCWLPFLKISQKFLRRLVPEAAAPILVQLSTVYPLSEKSATKVWGSHGESTTEYDSLEDFHKEEQSITLDTTTPNGSSSSVYDYSFYESFWRLQEDLSNPNSIKVAGFLSRVRSMMTAFENQTCDTNTSQDSPINLYGHYLTSSRVLAIQLLDASFQIHVLTQFLIVAKHLMAQVPVLESQLADHVTRAKNRLQLELGDAGRHQLELLHHLWQGSESLWRDWKRKKCPADIDAPKLALSAAGGSPPRKRLLGALGSGNGESNDADERNTDYSLAQVHDELPALSKRMKRLAPDLYTHLQDYVEALDPDAEIEAEYHPKNNALFGWRALRLLSVDHLGEFNLLDRNGDYEGLVRTIYQRKGIVIPGKIPESARDELEELEAGDPVVGNDDSEENTDTLKEVSGVMEEDAENHLDSGDDHVEAKVGVPIKVEQPSIDTEDRVDSSHKVETNLKQSSSSPHKQTEKLVLESTLPRETGVQIAKSGDGRMTQSFAQEGSKEGSRKRSRSPVRSEDDRSRLNREESRSRLRDHGQRGIVDLEGRGGGKGNGGSSRGRNGPGHHGMYRQDQGGRGAGNNRPLLPRESAPRDGPPPLRDGRARRGGDNRHDDWRGDERQGGGRGNHRGRR